MATSTTAIPNGTMTSGPNIVVQPPATGNNAGPALLPGRRTPPGPNAVADPFIARLEKAHKSVAWSRFWAAFYAQLFAWGEMGLVLLAIGFGVATTVESARGNTNIALGIGTTMVASGLALLKGTYESA